MTNEEYMQTQAQLTAVCTIVHDLDVTSFINAITNAETVGPILEPTLYREGMESLADV